MAAAEIKKLFKDGFIPGPGETLEQFEARVSYNQNLSKELEIESSPLLEEIAPTTEQLFGFSLKNRPVLFSNEKMGLFHGGCAWIFQKDEKSPLAAFFQLRRSLKSNKSLFGLYSREEILTHEALHIARMAFEEPKYEEILAYQTSNSGFRRIFGPLFRKPFETILLLLLLFLSLVVSLFLPIPNLQYTMLSLPFLYLTYLTVRLIFAHKSFAEARKRAPLSKLICLTDKEIDALVKGKLKLPVEGLRKELT